MHTAAGHCSIGDMLNKIAKMTLSLTLATSAAFGLGACGGADQPGSASGSATAGATEDSATSAAQTIIDVRTPQEFAAGHLDGAINIDIYNANFADEIGKLDKAGSYVLYCRSGSRAGQALTFMQDQGFTDVTNGGAMEAAAAPLGKDIVK